MPTPNKRKLAKVHNTTLMSSIATRLSERLWNESWSACIMSRF
jgi:hypothetical protein